MKRSKRIRIVTLGNLGMTDAEAAQFAQQCATSGGWQCAGAGVAITTAVANQQHAREWNDAQIVLWKQAVSNWEMNGRRAYVNGQWVASPEPPYPTNLRPTDYQTNHDLYYNPWDAYSVPGLYNGTQQQMPPLPGRTTTTTPSNAPLQAPTDSSHQYVATPNGGVLDPNAVNQAPGTATAADLITKVIDWAKANPLYAAGIVGLIAFTTRRSR